MEGENTSQNPAAPASASSPESSSHAPPPENPWLNLGLNLFLPSLILFKGSKWFSISPATVLVIALLFPISYGLYDFAVRRKYNFFSILGFGSILLTGGIGLLELDKDLIAIKEATVPAILGVAILASLKTRYPLVRTFLYNDQIINVPKVEAALQERGAKLAFEKLLVHCTFLLAFSFFLSSVLNYGLARYIIRSETGTEAFLEELARMNLWSTPVIAVPCMLVTLVALYKLFSGIKTLTGYEIESVLRTPPPKKHTSQN